MSWYEESVFYQIYPLGLTGAPYQNDGTSEPVHRLAQLTANGWVEQMVRLGANALILNPVFQSQSHGYDTVDYTKVDRRLGTGEDLRAFVDACHKAGVRVLLDGVFNHVGREFWAFRDVLEKREASPYAGWFCIDWGGNDRWDDHLSYECWQGVDELVKLNHSNFDLNAYLAEVIRGWERDYDIDGLRLDVAYCLDRGFLGYLRRIANELSERRGQKFLLLGETMFGDYRQWMGDDLCDTVTNYEVYKGLWSSFNSRPTCTRSRTPSTARAATPPGTCTRGSTCSTLRTTTTSRALPPSWTTRGSWSRSTASCLACRASPACTTAASGG